MKIREKVGAETNKNTESLHITRSHHRQISPTSFLSQPPVWMHSATTISFQLELFVLVLEFGSCFDLFMMGVWRDELMFH